jgi:hypothetical protein
MVRKTRIRSIYRIPGGPDAPAKARRIAARELGADEAPEVLENASLLLSEITAERLESDRAKHPDPRLTIDVRQTDETSGWSVIDRGDPALPTGLRSTALDELAQSWGVSRRSGLTRTWFKLSRRQRSEDRPGPPGRSSDRPAGAAD